MTMHSSRIDYRLLNLKSDMVLCSGCFQEGKVTPVPQLISARHQIKNQCRDCESQQAATAKDSPRAKVRLMKRYLSR